jgi:hypothetical protein
MTMGLSDKLKKAELKPETDDAIKVEMEHLLEEERAALRARAAGGISPPDEPTPDKIAQPPEGGLVGPCPVGGEARQVTAEDAARKSYACVCGETVKIKAAEMPDNTWRAKIPEHGPGIEEPEKKPKATRKPAATSDSKMIVGVQATRQVDLYLDCRPDGVAVSRLEAYADKIAAEIAAAEGVAALRSAEGGPLGYGKWKDRFEAEVAANPPPLGSYEVSVGHELGKMAFDKLASLGLGAVVRR